MEEQLVTIQDDIVGRLRNTSLPQTHHLLPLFEAVVNAIQSIDEADSSDRSISIQLHRETNQKSTLDENTNPIHRFTIKDTGSGFNKDNFKSFTTADSRYKERKGGKGVGRFLWLKAFDNVNITSIYKEDDMYWKRDFHFRAESPPIHGLTLTPVDSNQSVTQIDLIGFKEPYRDRCPREAELIVRRLIEHCILYLMNDDCPRIEVIDVENSRNYDVNKTFRDEVASEIIDIPFSIESEQFSASVIFLKQKRSTRHKILLCADEREVKSFSLYKYLTEVKSRHIPSPDGSECALLAVVKGSYLNERLNAERTDFAFDKEEEDSLDFGGIKEATLLEKAAELVREHIMAFVDTVREEKIKRIRQFVNEKEPEYRVILKHALEDVEKIPDGLDEFSLDIELHKIKHRVELELKIEGKEFLSTEISSAQNQPEYQARYDQYVSKLLDYNSSELSKYVIHRKTIIDLLGKALAPKDDGAYSKEDELHRFLYPQRTSSDDVDVGQQNLWLIDEKLTYHYFLASDTELSRTPSLVSNSRNRPDLLIYDRPASFVEGEYPNDSIVIIELKRPQRKQYEENSKEKDPITQVYSYMDDLLSGKVIDHNGLPVTISQNTRFYCYVIADKTEKLDKILTRQDFIDLPGGGGAYKFSKNYNAYIEVIGYRKLYEDAKKRNRILFNKLGLPTN